MASILRRMFSSKRSLKNSLAGIRNRQKLLEEDKSSDFEELDEQDISEFEADFMNIDESQKMHKRYYHIYFLLIFILYTIIYICILYKVSFINIIIDLLYQYYLLYINL